DAFASYGCNSDGLATRSANLPLGLGGEATAGQFAPPVAESEVQNPTEMLAFGDGMVGWDAQIKDG
ncbi:MAG: hypothetical protein L0Z50_33745, partial [Verrucomicrobiales bacterium]|nr:hypothetical protein [Verrucomicrobiales bacterium]